MKLCRAMTPVLTLVLLMFTNFASTPGIFEDRPPERIRFAKGASSATIKGTIKGYVFKDYIFSANAGQRASLKLTSTNIYAAFVIHRKGADPDEERSIESTEWENTLQESGEYVIRVLMMRAGARRPGATANYSLKLEIN
jgi:hypothetical protein